MSGGARPKTRCQFEIHPPLMPKADDVSAGGVAEKFPHRLAISSSDRGQESFSSRESAFAGLFFRFQLLAIHSSIVLLPGRR